MNFRDDGDTDAYAREMGIPFDIVLRGDALAGQVGVRGTPTLFVLDANDEMTLRSSSSDPDDPALRQAVAGLFVPA